MSAQRARDGAVIGLYDDTEEDLVGADWHQNAIRNVVAGLRDIALRDGLPWHVGDQLMLVAWKPNGTIWRPSPDIMVHPQGGPTPRKEMVARADGAPALIVEIASESTWRYDVNPGKDKGKAGGYMALGVPTYLVFDPTGEYLGAHTPCRGWQRVGTMVREWLPTRDGRYESRELGVSLQPDGDLLRVFDASGHPMLYEHEKTREIETQAREIERLRAELTQLQKASGEGG